MLIAVHILGFVSQINRQITMTCQPCIMSLYLQPGTVSSQVHFSWKDQNFRLLFEVQDLFRPPRLNLLLLFVFQKEVRKFHLLVSGQTITIKNVATKRLHDKGSCSAGGVYYLINIHLFNFIMFVLF